MNTIAPASEVEKWSGAVYAFLAEKERRSGSKRTVQAYSAIVYRFFGLTGKTPDVIKPADVFAFAHGKGASGRDPSSVTINSRLSAISSFYRFAVRMELLSANPCDRVERPRNPDALPRGLSAVEVRRLLAVVPETPPGLRDRAIILTLVLTGRRRSEVLGLTAGDIEPAEPAYYRYRGKGGKRGRRELPRPAFDAIGKSLAAAGRQLADMPPGESLWPTFGRERHAGISGTAFYMRFRRYLKDAGLPQSGLHVLRHSAAKLRRDSGASIESVSSFLDHSSLAVTTTYLRRLEGQEDDGWQAVAQSIGVAAV